jgi:hypothetical protein
MVVGDGFGIGVVHVRFVVVKVFVVLSHCDCELGAKDLLLFGRGIVGVKWETGADSIHSPIRLIIVKAREAEWISVQQNINIWQLLNGVVLQPAH